MKSKIIWALVAFFLCTEAQAETVDCKQEIDVPHMFLKGRSKKLPKIVETKDLVNHEAYKRRHKFFTYWDPVHNAIKYEICHQCKINDTTGERIDSTGDVYKVELNKTCNDDKMCFVLKNSDSIKHRFNVRVYVAPGCWSKWSVHRNFNVDVKKKYPEHVHEEL